MNDIARAIFFAGFQAANPSISGQEAAEKAWAEFQPPVGANTEETSAEIASLAASVLRRKKARIISLVDYNKLLEDAKRLAGSALTQRENHDART